MRHLRTTRLLIVVLLVGCKAANDTSNSGGSGGAGNQAAAGNTGQSPAGSGGAAGQPPSDAHLSMPGTGGAGVAPTGNAGTGSGGKAGTDPSSMASGGSSAPGLDAGMSDAAVADVDAGAIDAFNGMCASARWSNVSPECWSCWCSACADTLNAATRKSMEIFECMFDKALLVNDVFDLLCEVRAGEQDCVNGATDDWDKLVTFDMCLMANPTGDQFRACDTQCAVEYRGDVCERYP